MMSDKKLENTEVGENTNSFVEVSGKYSERVLAEKSCKGCPFYDDSHYCEYHLEGDTFCELDDIFVEIVDVYS
jgi:hypothetical protein